MSNHSNNGKFARQFGRRLRRCRTLSGLTQKELSARVGCDAFSLCNWERGTTVPNLQNFQRLVASLDVSPKRLLPK